jgi:peroxiredoxin family protein
MQYLQIMTFRSFNCFGKRTIFFAFKALHLLRKSQIDHVSIQSAPINMEKFMMQPLIVQNYRMKQALFIQFPPKP